METQNFNCGAKMTLRDRKLHIAISKASALLKDLNKRNEALLLEIAFADWATSKEGKDANV